MLRAAVGRFQPAATLRIGSREERREAYLRMVEAVNEYTVWQGWSQSFGADEPLPAPEQPGMAEIARVASEMFKALSMVRLTGSLEPIAWAERLMITAIQNVPRYPDSDALELVGMTEGKFTEVCRIDLYKPAAWQVWRLVPTWWNARRARQTVELGSEEAGAVTHAESPAIEA